jgi:lysyl endopeptidase
MLLKKTSYLLLIIFCIFDVTALNAQVSRSGEPVSWNLLEDLTENLNIISFENVDANALLAEDVIETEDKDIPLRFAQKQVVDLNLVNSGRWTNLPNGDRIWILGIHSEGAKALSVTFEDFFFPKGSVLYLYSPDRTQVIGALTNQNNKDSGLLTTSAILGEDLLIEYYEPYAVRQEGDISIRTIAHSYRNVIAESTDYLNSIECMLNLQCVNDLEVDKVGSSTVLITVDDGTRWCTGTLLNNANFDGVPYLITSSHNLEGDPNTWLFTFNLESLNCFPSIANKDNYSISGAELIEVDADSGMLLLELSERPDPSWNVYYAGWDASGVTPQEVYTVHHPKGNIKKYTHDDTAPLANIWSGIDVWSVNRWFSGSTTSGSTGSGFFDQNNRLIGTLHGGNSACDTEEGQDHFTRFSNSWSIFKKHLNPFNDAISFLDGTFFKFGEVNTQQFESNVAVFPNPAIVSFNIVNGNTEAVQEVTVFDLTGRIVLNQTYTGKPVSIEFLPIGNYIVQVQLETLSIQTKLLVLR